MTTPKEMRDDFRLKLVALLAESGFKLPGDATIWDIEDSVRTALTHYVNLSKRSGGAAAPILTTRPDFSLSAMLHRHASATVTQQEWQGAIRDAVIAVVDDVAETVSDHDGEDALLKDRVPQRGDIVETPTGDRYFILDRMSAMYIGNRDLSCVDIDVIDEVDTLPPVSKIVGRLNLDWESDEDSD